MTASARTKPKKIRPPVKWHGGIGKWDSTDTLIYCDPPYLHSTRNASSRDVYDCEMTEQEHRELAAVLNACRSRVVLSGYPSGLYNDLYAGWRVVSFDIANHAAGGQSKARKTETLWMNS